MIRAGIIGLGVGEAHIKGYQSHPSCRVTKLCDMDAEKRAEVSAKFPGMKIVGAASEILEDPDIDVVSIASYDPDHYSQVISALRNRKHVFVEKPLCLKRSEAQEIMKWVRERPDLKISSNLILRKYPRFQRIRSMIQAGDFGSLFLVEGDYNFGRIEKITEGWRGKVEDYSVVLGGGIHIIDLLRWLTGDEVTKVSAFGNRIASKASQFRYNDLVVGILEFKSGLIGKMSVNFGCVMPHFHRISVYGTQATFTNEPEGAFLYRSRDASKGATCLDDPYPGAKKGDLLYDFVESILDRRPSEIGVEDLFRDMSVCFAIDEAVSKAAKLTVNYL